MKKIFSFFLQALLIATAALYNVSCDRIIYDGEGDCPLYMISVQSTPDGGGISMVHEVENVNNSIETDIEHYVHIEVVENGTYTLTATPNEGYYFIGWHDDTHDAYLAEGEEVIAGLVCTGPVQYTAVFAKIAEPARISVRSTPDGGGISMVTEIENEENTADTDTEMYVSIEIEDNGLYTLTATPNEGYYFVVWHDDTHDTYLPDGENIISDLAATESVQYTAIFAAIDGPVRISVRSTPEGSGISKVTDDADADNTVETDGEHYVSIEVAMNGSYTLSAAALEGYAFIGWHDDTHDTYLAEGQNVITGLTATGFVQYTAIYVKLDEPVRISVRSIPEGSGISQVIDAADATNNALTDGDQYVSIEVEAGGSYTLSAIASEGYAFIAWHDDTHDSFLPEGQSLITGITATESTQYTATFVKLAEPVRISVRSTPAGGGISAVYAAADTTCRIDTDKDLYVSIEVDKDSLYTLSAVANAGYTFVGWHDDTHDSYLPTGEALIENLTATEAVQYTAIFAMLSEPETKYYVEYIYDMNMKFADAFYSQVGSVELFVFDTTGKLVKTYDASTAAGDGLDIRGYRMDVSDLEPGTYEFIAWCGLENNPAFKLPATIAKREDLTVALQHDGSSDQFLKSLFHGRVAEVTLLEKPQGNEQTVTVKLTKDTNNINLSLTQLGNAEMKVGQFEISMVDSNGKMDYTNALAGKDSIEYLPWTLTYGQEDFTGSDLAEGAVNYMHAELSTSRLMADHDPVIVITDKESGKVVISIPLVQWVKVFRSQQYATMSDQEYLDREDEYNVVLYLENNNHGWTAVSVVINDWRVKDNGQADL